MWAEIISHGLGILGASMSAGAAATAVRERAKRYPDRVESKWRDARRRYEAKAKTGAEECRRLAKRYGNANDLVSRAFMLNCADQLDALARLWAEDNSPPPIEKTLLPVPTKIVEDTPEEMRRYG